MNKRRKVRVTLIAVNMEIMMPMPSVMANPLMDGVPNMYKISVVIKLDTLESRMDSQARSNPS